MGKQSSLFYDLNKLPFKGIPSDIYTVKMLFFLGAL